MAQPDWQNQEDYRYLSGADRAGFAWEFLRRNPGYRAMAATSPPPAIGNRGTVELLTGGATALCWGLLFRRRPRRPCG